MQVRIANVKVSIKIKAISLYIVQKILTEKLIPSTVYDNYIVIKANYTFIVFKSKNSGSNNHINITKIPDVNSVPFAINEIETILNCEHFDLHVDNITASSNLNQPINLIEVVKKNNFKNIKYNNQKFPGLFLKFEKGTAIIFHSGKIVIVGCNKTSDIKWIVMQIAANI